MTYHLLPSLPHLSISLCAKEENEAYKESSCSFYLHNYYLGGGRGNIQSISNWTGGSYPVLWLQEPWHFDRTFAFSASKNSSCLLEEEASPSFWAPDWSGMGVCWPCTSGLLSFSCRAPHGPLLIMLWPMSFTGHEQKQNAIEILAQTHKMLKIPAQTNEMLLSFRLPPMVNKPKGAPK